MLLYILNDRGEIVIFTKDPELKSEKYHVALLPDGYDIDGDSGIIFMSENENVVIQKQTEFLIKNFTSKNLLVCETMLTLAIQMLTQYVDKFPENVKDLYILLLDDLIQTQRRYFASQGEDNNLLPQTVETLKTIRSIIPNDRWATIELAIDTYNIFTPTKKVPDPKSVNPDPTDTTWKQATMEVPLTPPTIKLFKAVK